MCVQKSSFVTLGVGSNQKIQKWNIIHLSQSIFSQNLKLKKTKQKTRNFKVKFPGHSVSLFEIQVSIFQSLLLRLTHLHWYGTFPHKNLPHWEERASWIEKIVFQASGLAGGGEPFLDLLDSMSVFSAKLGFENLLSKVDDSCQIYIETCQT